MNSARTPHPLSDPLVIGTVCGIISSLGYTASNICLRAVSSELDPAWVSCIKAVPTTLFFSPWFIVLAIQGRRILPQPKQLFSLAAAGLFGQLGGNVLFQWGLGEIGLALMVPLTLSGMILSGALLGKIFLNERVTGRAFISMIVLIIAATVLSLGADKAYEDLHKLQEVSSQGEYLAIAGGVAAALTAGLSYSVLGVAIRRNVTQGVPLTVAVVTVSVVGMLSLGALSLVQTGPEVMMQTTQTQWLWMAGAGIFNAAAFIALSMALKSTPVLYVNAVNASQAAMAAAAGLFFFGEPLSISLVVGVFLTMLGLVLTERRSANEPDEPPEENQTDE